MAKKKGEMEREAEDIQDQDQDQIEVPSPEGEGQAPDDHEVRGEELSADERLAQALEEKEDFRDKMLRMAAELENYKKRIMRERDNALKYAEENLVRDLLPTLDNLGRALEHNPEGDVSAFVQGVDMTLKGLLSSLEKAGLTPINSVGEVFDPNLHEAMVMEASPDVPEQCVIREFEKGYYFKDRLLRAAKVVVSKGNV